MTRHRLAVAVLAAVLAVVHFGAPPALAADSTAPSTSAPPSSTPPTSTPPTSVPDVPPDVVLAPAGADEAGRRRAQADLRTSQVALRKAAAVHKQLTARLVPLERRKAELLATIVRLEEDDKAATEALAAARDRVRRLAVAGYVIGGDVPPVDYLLRAESPADLVRRHSLVRNAAEAKAAALDGYQAAKQRTSSALEAAVGEADRVNAQVAQVANEVEIASRRVQDLTFEVGHRRQLLDVIAAAAPVGVSDIPRLFLDAYRRAAAHMQKRAAHCRVSWPAIAAIGKVESNHGRYRGARLALNGDVYPRIVGIPLDGTRGTRVIKDTDGGALDLDTVHDRAVGPMQFIPSTWRRLAQDGNGDGVKEPNNAYDAAQATAAYLCRAVPAGGLDREDALRRAFFSYNHSDVYVEHVLGWYRVFSEVASTL